MAGVMDMCQRNGLKFCQRREYRKASEDETDSDVLYSLVDTVMSDSEEEHSSDEECYRFQ